MLIIGTVAIPFTRDKGTFYCPRCRALVAYRGRLVRRFLTLYFIPLIPLDRMEEYVECGPCHSRFPRAALAYCPEQALVIFRGYVRHMLTRLAAEDSEILPAEVATFRNLVARLYGVAPTVEQADRDLNDAARLKQTTCQYLRMIHPYLTIDEKKTLVQYAFLMATAGGQICEARNAALAQFPSALGLTEEQFKQFISEAVAVE